MGDASIPGGSQYTLKARKLINAQSRMEPPEIGGDFILAGYFT
jgi:hypothetical protein